MFTLRTDESGLNCGLWTNGNVDHEVSGRYDLLIGVGYEDEKRRRKKRQISSSMRMKREGMSLLVALYLPCTHMMFCHLCGLMCIQLVIISLAISMQDVRAQMLILFLQTIQYLYILNMPPKCADVRSVSIFLSVLVKSLHCFISLKLCIQ